MIPARAFAAQVLSCPDPPRCPVVDPSDVASAPRHSLAAGTRLYRVYDSTFGYDEPNPGFGDTRFGPFDDLSTGARVGVLYGAETQTAALLETVFHDLDGPGGLVYEDTLRRRLLVHLETAVAYDVVDLRDPALHALGVSRSALASSSSEHYPCTRRVAQWLHAQGAPGIVWHSRQSEARGLTAGSAAQAEVVVHFTDTAALVRGSFTRVGPGAIGLTTDTGRTLVDLIADSLDATVVP